MESSVFYGNGFIFMCVHVPCLHPVFLRLIILVRPRESCISLKFQGSCSVTISGFLKSPLHLKMSFSVFALDCLSISLENDGCESLTSHSLMKTSLCLMEICFLRGGPLSMTSQILVQHSVNISVMWKLDVSGAQTLRMDFTVKFKQNGMIIL